MLRLFEDDDDCVGAKSGVGVVKPEVVVVIVVVRVIASANAAFVSGRLFGIDAMIVLAFVCLFVINMQCI